MIRKYQTPRSSKDGDQPDLKTTRTNEKFYVFNVTKDLDAWKKENTCTFCAITFENFHTLLNHKCVPHRCDVCGSAFQQDYMLKMHQCNTVQSDSSSSGQPLICTVCNMAFTEKNALSKHQSFCTKKKLCDYCGKQLPAKAQCDFCSKCRYLLQKDQKYSLRRNSSSTLKMAETGVKENGNGLHLLTHSKEINGDEKMDEPNHVDDYPSPDFSKLKRKRRSLDGIAENSNMKKTFESNAAESFSNSDTSLDQLDDRCNFKNRKMKKDFENLKKSLVTVLGNTSEKKRSDQSPVSKKDPEKSSSTVNASCNGVKEFKHKGIKGYGSDSDVLGLAKPFNAPSSTSLKRNLKEADLDSSTEPCVQKARKETAVLKGLSPGVSSLEKIDQVSLQPLRKSKRNMSYRKASLEHPSVEEKNKDGKTEERRPISVESSGPVTASTKSNFKLVTKNDAEKSVESSSVVNSDKDVKTTSKLSVGNSKEVLMKKSPRLNPVVKLSSTSLCESPKLKDSIKTPESAQFSVRKSKRRMNREESTKRSESSGKDELVKKNGKNCLTVEKEVSDSEPASHRSGRNAKHKKDSETPKNGSSCQGNPTATDSDAARLASSISAKPKRISYRKKYDDELLGQESDKHEDKNKSSARSPVSTPKKLLNRVASKNNKSDASLDVHDSASSHEKKKVDKARDVEKSMTETSAMSKADKPNIKCNEKTHKEAIQPRKQNTKNAPAKCPKTPENPSPSTRRGSFGSTKQNGNGAKPNSRNKINGTRTSQSSIDYTPELEVSESTLNSVPDVSFPIPSLSRGGNADKTLAKIARGSNSETDTIKLDSLLNVLPDGDSGVLLRVLSNTGDNYRCLKCNKLFKAIKMATNHYADCKTNRIKRTTSLLLKDIIWICVQCNYHCYQMSELNFHRQSCSKSPNNVSIDNCIRNYNNTCVMYCSKCSYSCISPIMFNQHPCEQRLEQMSKCVIGLEKLSVKDVPIQKYECTYCESTFLNLKAYKRHIAKHSLSTDERPQVIKQEPVDTSENVLKSLLEPLCSAKFSSFNLLMNNQKSSSLSEAAGKAFEEEDSSKKNRAEIGKILSFLQKEGDSSLPLDQPDSEPQVPDKVWRTYLRDYGCRCKKHRNAVEEKPCLACLNTYIKAKGSFSCQTDSSTQTDPPLLEDATVFPPTSLTDIPTLTIADVSAAVSVAEMSLGSSAQNFADSMTMSPSLDPPELPSIHITAVSSCTNQGLSISCSTSVDSTSLTDIPSFPPMTLMQNDLIPALPPNLDNDKFPPHSSSDSCRSELYISLILILQATFVDSKYSVEKHNNLVKSIYRLKFGKLAEPHQVHPDQYYLLTEFMGEQGHSKFGYDETALQNYFLIDRPFTELMPLFVSQEPCDFDVVLCDNDRHYIHLSWQFAPDICYSAFCVKSDSESTGIKFICGHCFDCISIHLLIEHFDEVHEGAYHYNILIS